jgi:hypothetical protein
LGGLDGTNNRAADGNRQPALPEFGLSLGSAGFSRFNNIHLPGHDVDVARRGEDVAADGGNRSA